MLLPRGWEVGSCNRPQNSPVLMTQWPRCQQRYPIFAIIALTATRASLVCKNKQGRRWQSAWAYTVFMHKTTSGNLKQMIFFFQSLHLYSWRVKSRPQCWICYSHLKKVITGHSYQIPCFLLLKNAVNRSRSDNMPEKNSITHEQYQQSRSLFVCLFVYLFWEVTHILFRPVLKIDIIPAVVIKICWVIVGITGGTNGWRYHQIQTAHCCQDGQDQKGQRSARVIMIV